jgi:hypothetical protein
VAGTKILMKTKLRWSNNLGAWTLLMYNLVGDYKLYRITEICPSGDMKGILIKESIQ